MKPTVILRRSIIGLLFALHLILAAPQQAAADSFDKMITILDLIAPTFQGVKVQDIASSKEYINCLVHADNDLEVAVCTDTFQDTKLGQMAASETGIPSWFWDLLDLYIDIRTGDIWGAVEHLGQAALCIVAQVLAEGYDVCGLIEELAALGDTLLDAAAAVGEFLADVGGAIGDAAATAGCALGIGGCDKPTPPEVRVYQWVFAPRLRDAIEAKKQVDATAYTALFNQLKDNASKNPAMYSVPSKTVTVGHITMVVPPAAHFSVAAVGIAASSFDRAVDANWTAYLVNTALGDLAAQRHDYNNPNQLRFLVNSATTDFETLQRSNPNLTIDQKLPELIINRCTTDFSETRKFAHVDRWITSHQAQAAQLGNPKTNRDWCSQLWEQNKQSFIQPLRSYASDHYCQEGGSGLRCASLNNLQSCTRLMGLVQQQGICTATNQVGREAANLIRADFQNRGSHIPCSIRNDSRGISPATVDLVCTRPTQGAACTTTYQRMFAGLPVKLVNCVVEERSDYSSRKNNFYAVVKSLQISKQFGIDLDPVDPLVAHVDATKEQLMAALQQTGSEPGANRAEAARMAQNLRYEFQHTATIDGEDTPLYLRARGGTAPVSAQQSGSALQATHTPAGGYHAPAHQTGGPTIGSGFDRHGGFTNPGNSYQQQQQSGIGNAAHQAAQQSGAASQQAHTRAMTPPAPGKPDLLVQPQLSIGNSTTQWGSSVVLRAQQLQPAGNGLCNTSITYTVQNSGTVASPAFTSMLLNSAAVNRPLPQQWAGIAQGASQSKTEQLLLRPGQNSLTLYLDQTGQLDELNKTNNQARLQVTLNGTCQPQYQPQQPVQQQPPQRQLPQRQLPAWQPGLF